MDLGGNPSSIKGGIWAVILTSIIYFTISNFTKSVHVFLVLFLLDTPLRFFLFCQYHLLFLSVEKVRKGWGLNIETISLFIRGMSLQNRDEVPFRRLFVAHGIK
jgi:hypothetical protein